jgi:lipoate-protein ligase A
MSIWRLIVDGAADGAWNMAVDRAILESHEAGDAQPTLRLYRWNRPTVSLGRFQRRADIDEAFCRDRGIGVCRRPTGGRGVLHDDELTYSIIAGVRDGVPRGVGASYRMLCGALVEAYRRLGVSADLTSRPRGERAAGACYLHATHADLSVGAAKLSGSAQVWSRGSCLQHGSFVISRDIERESAVFRLDERGRSALARTTLTISDATGARPEEAALQEAVVTGIASALGIRFDCGALDAGERDAAQRLVSEVECADLT